MTIKIETTPEQDDAIAAQNLKSNPDGNTVDIDFVTSVLTDLIDSWVTGSVTERLNSAVEILRAQVAAGDTSQIDAIAAANPPVFPPIKRL